MAAVAALNHVDPMRMLGLERVDFLIAQAIVERADRIGMERKKSELEALAKATRL